MTLQTSKKKGVARAHTRFFLSGQQKSTIPIEKTASSTSFLACRFSYIKKQTKKKRNKIHASFFLFLLSLLLGLVYQPNLDQPISLFFHLKETQKLYVAHSIFSFNFNAHSPRLLKIAVIATISAFPHLFLFSFVSVIFPETLNLL